MNDNTNSIDLAQLDKLPVPDLRYHAEYRRGYIAAKSDIMNIARRSLTSGAPAEDGCGCQQGQCCNVCDPIHDGTAPISGKASEVKVWLKAETASREAIKAYNAAVAESDRHIWPGTDINAEFQIMSAAKNKAFQAMQAMYDSMSTGAAAKTEQAEKPRNWAPNSPHNVCRQTEQNLRDEIYKLHAKLEAAAKTEQARVIGGQRWSKEDEMMESWAATAAGNSEDRAGSAQPEALDERALFMRAIDSTYPIPDTPHQSVAERAMAKREAFNKGWEQACAALTQQAAPEAPSRDAGQEEASTQTVQNAAKPACRMQGGICACHSGGSFGGCAIERGIVQRGFAIKEKP